MTTKNFTVREFNDKIFTVAELKNLLNQFNDSNKVDFTLWADAAWDGVIGDFSVDVNNETVIKVNL